MRTMRIFVTGATGFIGSRLTERLREEKHDLVCLVRESSKVDHLRDLGVTLVQGDVTDRDSLDRGMNGCEWVANLANLYEFWVPDRKAFHEVNVEGTRNVMEAALDAGVSKVVHVSSAVVFGDAPWPVSESTEPGRRCFSEYARSKREGDRVAWELFRERQLPLVVVYPGAVIGPDDPKAAGRYLARVLEEKLPAQVLRDKPFPWVSVGDVTETVSRALQAEGSVGETYLAVAENLTFGEISRMLADVGGVKLPRLVMPDAMVMVSAYMATGMAAVTRRPPMLDMSLDQMRLMRHGMRADGSKAARELGVTYTPIRATLEQIVERYRDQH